MRRVMIGIFNSASAAVHRPSFLARHGLAIVFAVLILIHWIGVYSVSGGEYIFAINIFAACVLLTYICSIFFLRGLFNQIADWFFQVGSNLKRVNSFFYIIDAFVIIFPVLYFIWAGYIPVIKMYFTNNYMVSSEIRYEFFSSLPFWQRYAGEYYIKGLVPLWLIFAYSNKRRLFPLIFIAASFFSFAIVTKAYIIVVFAPLALYLLFKRRWFEFSLLFTVISVLMILSVVVQHKSTLLQVPTSVLPPLSEEAGSLPLGGTETPREPRNIPNAVQTPLGTVTPNPIKVSNADLKTLVVAFVWRPIEALWLRSFSAIGIIEAQWLETYPAQIPFEKGCGYSWASKISNCPFVNLANKIWKKYYPELDERGLNGTVTASDYVQAYANFGLLGIVASATLIGVILVALNSLFPDPVVRVSLNTLPLALTFESVLTTLLNSSGWGLTIVMGALLFGNSWCKSTRLI